MSGRPRTRAGRPVNITDWDKQNQVLANWNNELCSGEELPEVEIISLLEEQIPRYKLRADTLTKFGGYENQDWFIPSPALEVNEADLKLSPDQIREVLNYFLLCSDRISQMSKTYDDIEAVTRLLEEKEKDLELTARIGKELLQTNNKLETSVTALETELRTANEKLTQLSHEVLKKTELIQILTNDMDESCMDTGPHTGRINPDVMQKRIYSLEDENKSLRNEYSRLAQDTDDVEAQEQRLLQDITGQLSCANSSMTLLEDELDRVREENRVQNEQIVALTAKLQDTELKLHRFVTDNDDISSLLQITRDNQSSLALELADFKSRYFEVEGLLRDAQEQLRKMRRRQMPVARTYNFPSLGFPSNGGGGGVSSVAGGGGAGAFDSLQSELEMSLHSELSSTDSGISNSDGGQLHQYKKVFETVRCASQSSLSGSGGSGNSSDSSLGGYVMSTGLGGVSSSGPTTARMTARTQSYEQRRSSGSLYSSSSLGYPSLDSTGQSDYESSQTDSEDGYPGGQQSGVPGVPGAADLEAALKRLTPGEVLARRTNLQHGPSYGGYEGESYLPFGCRTPDSLMSTGSSGNIMTGSGYASGATAGVMSSSFGGGISSVTGYNHQHQQPWRLPEKLQIVKPIEGSQTLHHWSQLAQPTLGGLLEERHGVKIKGGKELEDIGLETYGLSDLEEDEEYSNPGKMFESSGPIYTLTNSTVMHPDDGTMLTSSNMGSRVASVCSSLHNSPPETPRQQLSRRNSCSTFSTNYGLAKMLNERGIKAVTPSAYNTPCGVNSFTPTATPCNSPDGGASVASSRSSSPDPYDDIDVVEDEGFSLPQLILNSMPDFVQQTIGSAGMGSLAGTGAKKKVPSSGGHRKDKPGGGGKKIGNKYDKQGGLVNSIERMGLSNIMGSPGALSLSSGIYTRPSLTSPMAQLTCLLPSHSTENLSSICEKSVLETKPIKPTVPHTKPAPNYGTAIINPTGTTLGVPGKPGSDALRRRLDQLNTRKQRRGQLGGAGTRPDLGTVAGKNVTPSHTLASSQQQQQQQSKQQTSSLGTLSSLLFGRKGGLF